MAQNPEQQRGAQGTPQPRPRTLEERRALRRESRASQTYADFLRQLSERGGMSPHVAERAASSVLCALEERILPDEAKDMEAQLPVKLTELLHRCERHEHGGPPRKFGREEMLQRVGEDLALQPEAVEPVVRAVCNVLRARLSEGEAEDVMNQLPEDLRALWRRVS
ncbi:DUF2267 domain-containing protein [Aggregicoccus sp. 17bor-14]|uniref:DUF2267 domain-containing protein n=1 Tax=Myxococcaceae TaxID=31 RepID=UPI00129C6302|nr:MULTISPECIES: DUF2267 domain-containing protein [Myxococcaceae]MBF5041813.1 DUF2267 domain-containing protein [Simulacricoccus sp. 17bor-14]MRI87594.1 DUF2267 domain-containing protein [Aggregicoccus sp. 17bor-14]